MGEYLLIGFGFAFAAAVQPGPFQAFLLSSVVRNGWKRTIPASLAPLLSDGPVALLTLLVLNRLPDAMSRILQAVGGVFLLFLAWSGYSQWRRQPVILPVMSDSAPKTLLQAVVVNLLNPNPYLGWSLVLGPALLTAWHEDPRNGVALVVAFYATMVTVTACIVILFGTTQFFKPPARRALVLVSAILLAVLGVYQIIAGLMKAGWR